jgi:hypothetical protein
LFTHRFAYQGDVGHEASARIGDLKCACHQRCIQSGDKFPELLRCKATGPEQAAVLPDTETVERQIEASARTSRAVPASSGRRWNCTSPALGSAFASMSMILKPPSRCWKSPVVTPPAPAGLAIVDRISRLHDRRLELLPNPGGGLLARL